MEKKASYKSLEKMLRTHYGYDNDEALAYLRRTGQVYIDGTKYVISEKDRLISTYGKQNYKFVKSRKRK